MADADKINLAIAIISGLSAVASFAVCLATFRILKATQDTLETTKAQMLAARRPYLDIGAAIDLDQPVIYLTIRNTGSSAAERVRLILDKDFFFNGEADERNIRDLPIFRGPVDAIPPRAEIKLMLGVGHALYSRPDLSPSKFRVTAQYAFEGLVFDETSAIYLEAFKGHAVGKSPQGAALDKIAKATEAIAARLRT